MPTRGDIPGLKIVHPRVLERPLFTRRGGFDRWYWVATQICRADQIRGFRPRTICLWIGKGAPSDLELPIIRQHAIDLSLELKEWLLRPERKQRSRRGFVYFLRVGDRLKIGFSSDVERRISELQTGLPYKAELVLTIPGSLAMEKQLHHRFLEHRFDREWFNYSPSIDAFIKREHELAEARAEDAERHLAARRETMSSLRVIEGGRGRSP